MQGEHIETKVYLYKVVRKIRKRTPNVVFQLNEIVPYDAQTVVDLKIDFSIK